MEINEKIKLFFTHLGIPQKEIAQDNDVEPATVSQWFSGKRPIPLSFILWAVKVHKLDFNSLINDELPSIVCEEKAVYFNKKYAVEKILKDVEKSLLKNL